MEKQFAEFKRPVSAGSGSNTAAAERAQRQKCAELILAGVPFVLIWEDAKSEGTFYSLQGIARETVIGACRTLAAACQMELVDTLRRMFHVG